MELEFGNDGKEKYFSKSKKKEKKNVERIHSE